MPAGRGAHSSAGPRPLSWLLLELSNVNMEPEAVVQTFKRLIQLLKQGAHVCRTI